MNSTYSQLSFPCVNLSYMIFEDRLKTFQGWSSQIRPTKYELAQSGFYYLGCGDKVRCFSCGVNLENWEANDDSFVEHLRWSKNCPYLKVVGGVRTKSDNNCQRFGFGPPGFQPQDEPTIACGFKEDNRSAFRFSTISDTVFGRSVYK